MQKIKTHRLLLPAVVFLGLFSVVLTFSPSLLARNGSSTLRWAHWIGFAVWVVGAGLSARALDKSLPGSDRYLFAVTAFLAGWGLLTIWRLTPVFGVRQTVWLAVGMTVLIYGVRYPGLLVFLKRYKYVWLTAGLLLTFATLILGTNPMGSGPRLWLGCCGVYFQPSELLKLLLIVYLAGYLSDHQGLIDRISQDVKRTRRMGERLRLILPILMPISLMTGIALLLLLFQRDLGTALVFIFIYTVMIYLATGWKWVPLVSFGGMMAAGGVGYLFVDVVHARIQTWLNPWLDPSGQSYQIVQSLISIANGGVFGRGPGIGSPTLVPVAHSDFLFTALAEETGLFGTIGLFILLGIFLQRGIRIALNAPNTFQRYLAAGLTVHIVAQSLLIIGGNMRLLPLTGVTLPFLSYGGSSLLVSFLSLLILCLIAGESSGAGFRHPEKQPYVMVASFLLLCLSATALANGWWAVARGPALLKRTDNPRRAISDRFVRRGALQDRHDKPIVETIGEPGAYRRFSDYPGGAVIGYNHPVYGQSGLEASLDSYLRGLEGGDPWTLWWHHLLYGQPPPGVDVRLTLDVGIQQDIDRIFGRHKGGLVLINAESGEIYAMVSRPGYDANRLDEDYETLISNPDSPFVNRITQGRYAYQSLKELLTLQQDSHGRLLGVPDFRIHNIPVASLVDGVSPLQVVLSAAMLSNGGVLPSLRIALAIKEQEGEWISLPALSVPRETLLAENAILMSTKIVRTKEHWYLLDQPEDGKITWFAGGTLPENKNIPFAVVVVLEEDDPDLAKEIGEFALKAVVYP